MHEQLRLGWATCLLLTLSACGGAPPPPPVTANESVCSGARAVALDDSARGGAAFARLRERASVPITFRCPAGVACRLPEDQAIAVDVMFESEVACELASCQVPYAVASLPPPVGSNEPCPPVLWSTATVALATSGGTIDLTGANSARKVNVLATRAGAGSLRFIVESPASVERWLSLEQPNVVLLDVQLELASGVVRGQLSALAAPLPAEPAADLRFTALWTATWESAAP